MTAPLLVRDVMTIGVPICGADEVCSVVAERLEQQHNPAEVVVALDEDGIACGWLTRERLGQAEATRTIRDVMDEDIPTVPPEIPAAAAAQIMRDRGNSHLFLMHDWPGERRPSAVIALQTIEQALSERTHANC